MRKETRKTILLVEDEILIAIAEARRIEGFGYEVLIANTGEKAISLAIGEDKIDLALMDIDLGKGIDGPEAARIILATRHLPIVFLTSREELEYVERVRQISRYGYVIKGSTSFALRSAIEMAFELFEANENARKKAAALQASDKRCDEIVSRSSDYIFSIYIRESKISKVSHNPSCLRVTGYAADELEANPRLLIDLIHPDDRERARMYSPFIVGEPIAEIAQDPPQEALEIRIIRKEGSIRWIRAMPLYHRDEKGSIAICDAIVKDITEEGA